MWIAFCPNFQSSKFQRNHKNGKNLLNLDDLGIKNNSDKKDRQKIFANTKKTNFKLKNWKIWKISGFLQEFLDLKFWIRNFEMNRKIWIHPPIIPLIRNIRSIIFNFFSSFTKNVHKFLYRYKTRPANYFPSD